MQGKRGQVSVLAAIGLERLPDAAVRAGAPRRRHPFVQRLPDQRVREAVTARPGGRLDHEARRDRLVERIQELVLAERDDVFEQCGVEVAPDDRGHA